MGMIGECFPVPTTGVNVSKLAIPRDPSDMKCCLYFAYMEVSMVMGYPKVDGFF